MILSMFQLVEFSGYIYRTRIHHCQLIETSGLLGENESEEQATNRRSTLQCIVSFPDTEWSGTSQEPSQDHQLPDSFCFQYLLMVFQSKGDICDW